MNNKKTKRFGIILIGQIALALLLLGAIELVVRMGIVGKLYLSEPTEVVKQIYVLLTHSEIYHHLRVTMQEFFIGYLLAAGLGIATGMFLVLVRHAEDLFRPFLSALMAVPKVTIIPLIMLWMGIGIPHKIAVVFLFATLRSHSARLPESSKRQIIISRWRECFRLPDGKRLSRLFCPQLRQRSSWPCGYRQQPGL